MSIRPTPATQTIDHGEGSFPSDPKISGPGLWFLIHTCAKEAKTEDKKMRFVDLIDTLARFHPCSSQCRPHIQEHLRKHPIKNFWSIKDEKGVDVGLFLWSFNFHNEVNARLGKKQLDWQTAYHMYANDDLFPCTSECGDIKNSEIAKETAKKPRFSRRER